MAIETLPEVKVNLNEVDIDDSFYDEVAPLENSESFLVYLRGNISHMDKLKKALGILRASNASSIFLLEPESANASPKEIVEVIKNLREWDQLLLHNLLQLLTDWIPEKYRESLRQEAKTELKWYREWAIASFDTHIYKIPTLPWRSYIRKIINENYNFAVAFMKLLTATPRLPEPDTDILIRAFLDRKKKVVCVFPKKWSKMA